MARRRLLSGYCLLRSGELAGLCRLVFDPPQRTVAVEEAAVGASGWRVMFGPPKTAASRHAVPLPPARVRRAVNAPLFIMLFITNWPVGQSTRARTKSNRHE